MDKLLTVGSGVQCWLFLSYDALKYTLQHSQTFSHSFL